uniref:Uncharacterized protein n=1 Tax=Rhizophora mucronata TaxID=61149 RepID=A0A2P2IIC0_RHIMU
MWPRAVLYAFNRSQGSSCFPSNFIRKSAQKSSHDAFNWKVLSKPPHGNTWRG